jgi:hypothetical protein
VGHLTFQSLDALEKLLDGAAVHRIRHLDQRVPCLAQPYAEFSLMLLLHDRSLLAVGLIEAAQLRVRRSRRWRT